MGRCIEQGTTMEATRDTRVVRSTLPDDNVVLERAHNSEGEGANAQVLPIDVSEPVQSSNNMEECPEPKEEKAQTDGVAAAGGEDLEGSQILTAEMMNNHDQTLLTTRGSSSHILSSEESPAAGKEPQGERFRLTIDTEFLTTSSPAANDAAAAVIFSANSTELELGLKARDKQVVVSTPFKRPAEKSPRAALSLHWNPAEARERCKRTGELMTRNRPASWGSNSSPEEINLSVEANSLVERANVTDRRLSSREASPEPSIVPMEEQQERLRRQAIQMRMRRRTAPSAPRPLPANATLLSCYSNPELLTWIETFEKRNEEMGRGSGSVERYNFDIERGVPVLCEWQQHKQQ